MMNNNKEKELIIKDIYKRIKKYNIVLCGTQTFKSRINEIQVLRRMEKFHNFMKYHNINGFGCRIYEGYGNNFHIHSIIGISDDQCKVDYYIKLFRDYEKGVGINDYFEFDFEYYKKGNCWIRYMLKQNMNVDLFYTHV
jgi:hypothetical protein